MGKEDIARWLSWIRELVDAVLRRFDVSRDELNKPHIVSTVMKEVVADSHKEGFESRDAAHCH